MPISLKPGARVFGSACETELIVMSAPADPVDLTIGGVPPVLSAADRSGVPPSGSDGGALLGKRYVDAAGTIELLCTKAGSGAIALGGEILEPKGSKPLPASD